MGNSICVKEDLEEMRCQRCNQELGEEVYVIPKCHEESTVIVSYYDGMIRLECPVCKSVVLIVKVAQE